MLTHPEKITVAAHRGDSANHYENTFTAFRAAIAAGADMIELDVQMTKDGEIIVMHDHTVNRTTNGTGRISELTLAEISALNAGDPVHPEQVPTFAEFMVWASTQRITLNIEIKEYYSEENRARCESCIEGVIAKVEEYGMRDAVILNSFDAWVLEYIYKKYGKTYPLHGFYPYSVMKNVSIDPAEYLYCACVCGKYEKSKFDYLLERNIEPWLGADVTQDEKLDLCLSYGGRLLTVNDPKRIIDKLAARGKR